MALQTESRTSADLLKIVNEAVSEADALRKRLVKYERTLLSTRMIMGHELKRPATAIKGYLDLALEKADGMSSDTIDAINKARKECGLLDELSSFFLKLLRVDGTLSPVKHETADINACVNSIIGQMPEGLDASNRVTVNVSPDAGVFGTNADAIKLVLANLVENALIYSGPRSQVSVSIERADDRRGMGAADLLKISVQDKGKGIPDAFIQKIFRPFVRLQDDITDGSGLGLTLVRSLVELYGGNVYIRSEENHGTTVNVTIPETAKAEEPSVSI
jgi:two-component system phosphate regulon sensor histidine kinase PhoR